jgi:hypothetical protein
MTTSADSVRGTIPGGHRSGEFHAPHVARGDDRGILELDTIMNLVAELEF